TFYGHRQFLRTTFSGNDAYFKAALYIQGANHGQFNTVWGDSDITDPTSWLLNKADLLEAEDQRQIAKVYISAFLEATLNGRDEYIPMFRDYRRAADWLPDTVYVSRFEGSSFRKIGFYGEESGN